MLGLDEDGAAEVVGTLVAKSLVTPMRFDYGTTGYRYLESLREFGVRALVEEGALTSARLALEAALLPTARLNAEWRELVNKYMTGRDVTLGIEDATRRDAATHALDEGRLDAAALIFSSCAFRDHPGALDATLVRVCSLAAQRDTLEPLAWRAANAVKLLLERLTRRYEDCITTAIHMLDALDDDDPARGWFDGWRCTLITAVAPEPGLVELARALEGVRAHAQPPDDWELSQLLLVQATGLAITQQLDASRVAAAEGLEWAGIGRESRDQALAMALWLAYLSGDRTDPTVQAHAASQSQQLGLAELCAAPAALCAEGSTEDRAQALVAAARRRPSTDVTTPFLLAFAWLAVERDDLTRAAGLAEAAEIYDSSTEVALIYVLARVRGWTNDTWAHDCNAAIVEYLDPAHEAAAREGPAVLAAEIEGWEQVLPARGVAAKA
jgi:hypothetical protein